MKIFKLLLECCVISILAVVLNVSLFGQAQAAGCPGDPDNPGGIYGRLWLCGYFTDTSDVVNNTTNMSMLDKILPIVGQTQYDGLTEDWDTTPITFNTFVSSLHDRVFDGTSFINEARASSIIDIMLGKQGPDFGGDPANGVAYAQAHWSDWVNLISAYNSGAYPGYTVNFNEFIDLSSYDNAGSGIFSPDSSGSYECDTTTCYPDIAFETGLSDLGADFAVVFRYPGGQFQIIDWCGNLTGDIGGLPLPVTSSNAPTCGSVLENPGHIDPSTKFTITAAIDFDNAADAVAAQGAGDKIQIKISGPSTYDSGKLAVSLGGASLNSTTGIIGPTSSTGTYTVSYNLYDTAGAALIPTDCTGTFVIANMPYFSVTGGDVSAGAGMNVGNVSCAVAEDPKGGIVGWNKESPSYAGTGTQYAAFALNYLQDYATAQTTSPLKPESLGFSNMVNVIKISAGTDSYGGGFRAEPCVPNYYKPPSVPTTVGNTTINTLPAAGNNTQFVQGPNARVIINLPGTLPNRSRTTVYVDGDVYIASNITYSDNYPGGIADIPSYSVVANGNIYIAAGVTKLNGIFISEPDPSANNGFIYTCASAVSYSFAPIGLNQTLYNTCKNQLDVYGSLIGRQIHLMRTFGSLYGANQPAERVYFTPETWLAGGVSNNTMNNSYDGLIELAPAL